MKKLYKKLIQQDKQNEIAIAMAYKQSISLWEGIISRELKQIKRETR